MGAQAQNTIRGTVTHVSDGDTLVISVGRDKFSIRLGAGVDAPETAHQCSKVTGRCGKAGQPHSDQARDALAAMALNRPAVANCSGASYSRVVCRVDIEGRDMSMQMAMQGWVWTDSRYAKDPLIKAAVLQAQVRGLGIWAHKDNVPPWTWRKICWEGGICGS